MLPIQHPPASNSQQLPNPSLINSANGLQNFQPQNQFSFFNPNTQMGNMGSSMFQQPGFMNLPNNHHVSLHNNSQFVPPGQMGSVSGFPAQGSFNQMNPCLPLPQFFAQNIPNLLQQLNQNLGLVNGQFFLPFHNMNQHVSMNMSQNSSGGPNQPVPMVLQNQTFGANQGFYPVNQNQNPQNFIPQTMGGNGSRPLMSQNPQNFIPQEQTMGGNGSRPLLGQNLQNFIPQTMGGNCPRTLMGPAQQLPGNSTMPFNSTNQLQQAWNLQSPAFTGPQGNSSINDGCNRPDSYSKNLPHGNFTKNSRKGFQKNRINHLKNEKKKFGFPHEQKGKGFHNERRNKFGVTSSTDQANIQKRIFSMIYTEREIKQWREARQRNYPSSANIQKRLANKRTDSTVVDREARLLRQELSEILAKQAELGVEVAEIPSEYLSYSENCDVEKQHGGRDTREEAVKRNSHRDRLNKRGRRDKRNRPKKKAKFEKRSSNTSSLNMREPTLLQKLLKADIKRENSQLLQALRFTVMNSFFKEWPNKPLMFPSEIVEENRCESNVVDEKSMSAGNFSSQGTNNAMVQKRCHDDDNANGTGDRKGDSDKDNDDDSDNDNDDDHNDNDNDDNHNDNDNDEDHNDNDNDEDHNDNDNNDDHCDNKDNDHIGNDVDKFEGDGIPIAEEEEGEIID